MFIIALHERKKETEKRERMKEKKEDRNQENCIFFKNIIT